MINYGDQICQLLSKVDHTMNRFGILSLAMPLSKIQG